MKRAMIALAAVLTTVASHAGVTEIPLKLPLRPRLDIADNARVAVVPFVILATDESASSDRAGRIDLRAEFQRYLRKELDRNTELDVVSVDDAPEMPGRDVASLVDARDFWRRIGARTASDVILTGLVDFDVEDRAGYRTEEYVSPIDGRTYYRQVLVEKTGFIFDVVVLVFDSETGEKLAEENFRDFKEFDESNYDELLGLFENLRSLETQLLSIFVSQETSATRYLFTQ